MSRRAAAPACFFSRFNARRSGISRSRASLARVVCRLLFIEAFLSLGARARPCSLRSIEVAPRRKAATPTNELRDRSHVGRLGTLRAFALLERDARALDEGLKTVACDIAVVHEQVLRAFIRTDEAVPLAVVEPLDGSVCHKNTSLTTLRTGEEGVGTQTELALISRYGSTRPLPPTFTVVGRSQPRTQRAADGKATHLAAAWRAASP